MTGKNLCHVVLLQGQARRLGYKSRGDKNRLLYGMSNPITTRNIAEKIDFYLVISTIQPTMEEL